MSLTLDEIAIKHGTDKATVHPVKGHGYAPFYARFFEPLRWRPIKLLEIGVGGGESIRTWLEYFPRASVFGVDNNQSTNDWNTVKAKTDLRYTFVYGDQSDPTFWKCFAADYGKDWTVIVDDGSHKGNDVIVSFQHLWEWVMPKCFYCIEDLATAYGLPVGHPNHVQFLKGLLDLMNNGGGDVESIHFFQELAVLIKK